MVENVLAAVVVAICVVLMIRLALGETRRYRFDMAARRLWSGVQRRTLALWHWRSSRREAKRVAEEAIRRARGEGEWDGNVYRPKSFKKPPKNKMH